ncbi:GTP cyclohydrolase II [Streptomyces albireticuli]|uniref:GTP cyclohydrolase II n=1 Tax=Streptomyces albireticuli TaxID=1940 RepID=A0A2A2CVU1_9ACTN|nr:GTP cyclohydrolase II [Streptomyces albireticuli]MCD9145501.1 GTP cyclohydrolase II [Streptomyces albireticuli]MCD9165210.1 GTP cyclohydrolase II [Streptomyces albireticuli]MCD9195739.1 GTP cyclohydrolase II [Streptomyces albireticuli]PAU44328.1 GTP cyclohydrolase [Streptomyces albireticuli]
MKSPLNGLNEINGLTGLTPSPARQAPARGAPAPRARTAEGARIRNEVRIPLHLGGGPALDATVATFDGLPDGLEHLAVRFPAAPPPRASRSGAAPPLVRLHSECMTGDVFGSARCDCGPQLHEALRQVATAGGCLLYLRQEGRGIGLYNKLDAYRLQDGGLDTYAANRALGLADDLRDYTGAAWMLRALGHEEIDLLTNNPDKPAQLSAHGIRVRRVVPTGVFANRHNLRYLTAKVTRTAHTIDLEGASR